MKTLYGRKSQCFQGGAAPQRKKSEEPFILLFAGRKRDAQGFAPTPPREQQLQQQNSEKKQVRSFKSS